MEDRDAFQAAQNSLLFLHLNLSHGNTQLKPKPFSNAPCVGQNTQHQLILGAREPSLSPAGLNERALDWNCPPGADFKLEAHYPEHSWGSMTLQQGRDTFPWVRG